MAITSAYKTFNKSWMIEMALPKFNKAFKSAALGLGALAMVSAANIGIPSQAHADDAWPAVTSATSYNDYQELGLPSPEAPTVQHPYHYMRFDSQTKARYPSASAPDIKFLNADKLLVMNFIDEKNPQYSNMQTQVLKQTLSALASRSQDKELMLVDVVVRDAQGNMPYVADYELYFKDNELGPDGGTLEGTQIPYLVAWGEPLTEDGDSRLFDAALMNGVKNDADLNANADAIFGKLYVTVESYNNQKKVASLASNNPTLAANTLDN